MLGNKRGELLHQRTTNINRPTSDFSTENKQPVEHLPTFPGDKTRRQTLIALLFAENHEAEEAIVSQALLGVPSDRGTCCGCLHHLARSFVQFGSILPYWTPCSPGNRALAQTRWVGLQHRYSYSALQRWGWVLLRENSYGYAHGYWALYGRRIERRGARKAVQPSKERQCGCSWGEKELHVLAFILQVLSVS